MAKRTTPPVADRRFIATVKMTSGAIWTTVVYGPNASAAEARKLAEPGVERVIVRSEIRT